MAKKKVNVELNMTPFIGLFALLVIMLLLTSAWNHIAVLSTDTSSTTSSDSPANDEEKVNLYVTILSNRIEMSEDEKASNVPHINGSEIDKEKMIQILNQWKQKYPDRSDVVLNTENTVTYNQLITVFDTLVGNEWPDVGVNTQ